jgi:hypothetical protein
MWKEVAVVYFKVLSWYFAGRTTNVLRIAGIRADI